MKFLLNTVIVLAQFTKSQSLSMCHPSRKKKTMKLSRALSDLVKYTCSVGLYDIEAQGKTLSSRH